MGWEPGVLEATWWVIREPCQDRGSGSRDEPRAGEEGGSRREQAELGAAEPRGASMGRHLKEWFYSQFSKKPSR